MKEFHDEFIETTSVVKCDTNNQGEDEEIVAEGFGEGWEKEY